MSNFCVLGETSRSLAIGRQVWVKLKEAVLVSNFSSWGAKRVAELCSVWVKLAVSYR